MGLPLSNVHCPCSKGPAEHIMGTIDPSCCRNPDSNAILERPDLPVAESCRAERKLMQIYLAPMEGITGHIVRNAFYHHFGCIDKYFTAFIPAAKRLSRKILRDIDPENNQGITLIPQLISNRAEEIPDMIRQLQDFGYQEFNLNLGCPSGTVVSKKRGSGMLLYPQELSAFLEEIYQTVRVPVSVKTRIGFQSLEEWPVILDIYTRFPIHELIIHPRLRSEFYNGFVHPDAFKLAYDKFRLNDLQYPAAPADLAASGSSHTFNDVITSHGLAASGGNNLSGNSMTACALAASGSKNLSDDVMISHRSDASGSLEKLCYNGDIWDMNCYHKMMERFPEIDHLMIGRGLLARPDMACRIKGVEVQNLRAEIRAFCEEIYDGYQTIFTNERDVVGHMKEIWANLGKSFQDSDRLIKKLLKIQTPAEYKALMSQIFETLDLAPR